MHDRTNIYIHYYILSFYNFSFMPADAMSPNATMHADILCPVRVRVSYGSGQAWAAECVMLSQTACL